MKKLEIKKLLLAALILGNTPIAHAFDIWSLDDRYSRHYLRVIANPVTHKFGIRECLMEDINNCGPLVNHREFTDAELNAGGIELSHENLYSMKALYKSEKQSLVVGGVVCVGGTAVTTLLTWGTGLVPGLIIFCGIGGAEVGVSVLSYSEHHGTNAKFSEAVRVGLSQDHVTATPLPLYEVRERLEAAIPK